MNKNDLIASVASSAGLSKSDATRAIESFLDAVTNSLKGMKKLVLLVLEILVLVIEKQQLEEIQELVSLYKYQLLKDQSLPLVKHLKMQ